VCICVKICMPSYSYVCVLQLDVSHAYASHTCICVAYLYMCKICMHADFVGDSRMTRHVAAYDCILYVCTVCMYVFMKKRFVSAIYL